MQKLLIVVVVSFLILFTAFCVYSGENDILEKYPHVILSNGIIEASVFLPDAEKGFYRSTRFEWSGMIWQLTYKNHTYFLQRNEPNPLPLKQDHDPEKPNHAASLADQFEKGPARREGEKTYMLIGIGNLDCASGKLVDPGVWDSSSGKNRVEFIHKLSDDYGRSYRYVKRMELTSGKPELVISYSLENMGTQTLVAEQYNHNFFTIDNEYIGENYELELFFPPVFETFHPEKFNRQRSFMPYSKIQDNKIIVLQDVDVDVGIFSIMSGFGNSVSHHHGIIRNKRTRACVDIKGDTRLAGFHFWTDIITFCPEFFIGISVKPGETQNWKRIYTFYEE